MISWTRKYANIHLYSFHLLWWTPKMNRSNNTEPRVPGCYVLTKRLWFTIGINYNMFFSCWLNKEIKQNPLIKSWYPQFWILQPVLPLLCIELALVSLAAPKLLANPFLLIKQQLNPCLARYTRFFHIPINIVLLYGTILNDPISFWLYLWINGITYRYHECICLWINWIIDQYH